MLNRSCISEINSTCYWCILIFIHFEIWFTFFRMFACKLMEILICNFLSFCICFWGLCAPSSYMFLSGVYWAMEGSSPSDRACYLGILCFQVFVQNDSLNGKGPTFLTHDIIAWSTQLGKPSDSYFRSAVCVLIAGTDIHALEERW